MPGGPGEPGGERGGPARRGNRHHHGAHLLLQHEVGAAHSGRKGEQKAVFRIRRIFKFLGYTDLLVRGPDPNPSIIKQKIF